MPFSDLFTCAAVFAILGTFQIARCRGNIAEPGLRRRTVLGVLSLFVSLACAALGIFLKISGS